MEAQYYKGKLYNLATVEDTDIIAQNKYFTVRFGDKPDTLQVNELKVPFWSKPLKYNLDFKTMFAIVDNYLVVLFEEYFNIYVLTDGLLIKKPWQHIPYYSHGVCYIIHMNSQFMIVYDELYGMLFDTRSPEMTPTTIKIDLLCGRQFDPAIIGYDGKVTWFKPFIENRTQFTVDDHTYYIKDIYDCNTVGLDDVTWIESGYVIFHLTCKAHKLVIDLRNKCWINISFTPKGLIFMAILPYGSNGFVALSSFGINEVRAPHNYNQTNGEYMNGNKTEKYTIFTPISGGRLTKPAIHSE